MPAERRYDAGYCLIRQDRCRRHLVRANADVAERSGPTGRDVTAEDGRNFRPTSNRGWEVMSTLLQEKQVFAPFWTIHWGLSNSSDW